MITLYNLVNMMLNIFSFNLTSVLSYLAQMFENIQIGNIVKIVSKALVW